MTIEPDPFKEHKRGRLRAAEGMNGWCGIQDCRQPQLNKLPLCEDHAWDVWREMDAKAETLQQREASERRHREWEANNFRKLIEEREARRKGTYRSDPGLIYYLQVEDQIKIGFTKNLDTRLGAYPPMARLLATHPGTQTTESLMHQKFSEHLAGRKEWFRIHDELEAHINQVRQSFKQDNRVAA